MGCETKPDLGSTVALDRANDIPVTRSPEFS